MNDTAPIGILAKLGIGSLNPMQQAAYKAIVEQEKDVIILSPTGTGKTLAYLLPLLQCINPNSDELQAVVIVPGRELALQSYRVLSEVGGVRSCACYGGRMTMEEHRTLIRTRPQVVFATPGRLNDHLGKGNISTDAIRLLIIDEFDKCLDMGFENEMYSILNKLPYIRRRILLSATDSPRISRFIDIRSGLRIDFLSETEVRSSRITVYEVRSPEKDKLPALYSLLCTIAHESTIVFLNHRESVERTNTYLIQKGFITAMLHGALDQQQREAALYRFSHAAANVLVCTDLASRGLDIAHVRNIIHYHLPETKDAYIHRIGRTARWNETGNTYFLLSAAEQLPAYIPLPVVPFTLPASPPEPPHPQMSLIYIGKGKKDKISKADILGFLCKRGGLAPTDIGRIDVLSRYAYAAVRSSQLQSLLATVTGEKIKGIKTIIEEMK